MVPIESAPVFSLTIILLQSHCIISLYFINHAPRQYQTPNLGNSQQLCLRVGTSALSKSGYITSSCHALRGKSILEIDHWRCFPTAFYGWNDILSQRVSSIVRSYHTWKQKREDVNHAVWFHLVMVWSHRPGHASGPKCRQVWSVFFSLNVNRRNSQTSFLPQSDWKRY